MVWTIVTKKEKEEVGDNYFIEFAYYGCKARSYISREVLNYCHIDNINVGDEIMVSKVYNGTTPVYLIRKVEKK